VPQRRTLGTRDFRAAFDINDPASRVSQLKANTRNYGLLEETNTKPRTSYLARLKNPNPEIAVAEPSNG
jgi:hypothetical protein